MAHPNVTKYIAWKAILSEAVVTPYEVRGIFCLVFIVNFEHPTWQGIERIEK